MIDLHLHFHYCKNVELSIQIYIIDITRQYKADGCNLAQIGHPSAGDDRGEWGGLVHAQF